MLFSPNIHNITPILHPLHLDGWLHWNDVQRFRGFVPIAGRMIPTFFMLAKKKNNNSARSQHILQEISLNRQTIPLNQQVSMGIPRYPMMWWLMPSAIVTLWVTNAHRAPPLTKHRDTNIHHHIDRRGSWGIFFGGDERFGCTLTLNQQMGWLVGVLKAVW